MAKKLSTQGGLMRFRNEFNDISGDFKELSGIHRAVQIDEKRQPKVSKRQEMFQGQKRKFSDAGDMVSEMAKQRRASKGKDEFSKQKKILKKFKK